MAGLTMAKLKLPRYVKAARNRHGALYYYLRRPGYALVRLPGSPYSTAFMDAYDAAMAGQEREPIGASRTKPGTFNALRVAYYGSAEFKILGGSTQATYRRWIDSFCEKNGGNPAAALRRTDVQKMVDSKAATPAAANNLLRMLRMLTRFAIDRRLLREDPTRGVKPVKYRTEGFRTWSEADISTFEKAHPVGSRARLALALLLYTGVRRSDVVKLGPQNIRGEAIHLRAQKTGAYLAIPVHPVLRAVIDATPTGHLTFLVAQGAKSFSPAGFTNWFRDCCVEAGLEPGLAPHGLRKAMCRRLAEAGATTLQIMSITGHKAVDEIETYVRAASQQRLAQDAMAKIESATENGNPEERVSKRGA